MEPVSLVGIQSARARIESSIHISPCQFSHHLSELTGLPLHLKLENLQRTGSFKERGALNKLLTLSETERKRGVIAASAGNHAQGVAFHAAQRGIRAQIVMPLATPQIKVAATRAYGAEVILHGASYDEACEEALRRRVEEGRTFIHPFDDPEVICGQGTIGLELLEQVPDIEAVVVPIGGGSPVPKGTVGELIRTPADATHAYRVRFADGCEGTVRRQEFSLLKHVKNGPLGDSERALKEYDLYDFVIYRCVVGSQAYGLSHEDSDVDRRGIYLPPADLHWSLYGVPEQLENAVAEEVYWELQKFLVLALKANPNVLECLYSPLIETKTELAEDLLSHRDAFLSKLVYQTYNGYVLSQFKRLEQDLRATGAIKWKHAMHLIRLLLSGITVLREGFVPLSVESHRAQLLSIRRGEMDWESVNAWRLNLHQEFETAYAMTALPDSPDYQTVNDFLLRARRRMAR